MSDLPIKKKPAIKNYEKLLANQNDLENKTTHDIQLSFNLKNASKDCYYSLHLSDPDNNINKYPLGQDFRKCSDSKTIFFFNYNYDFSFGKEQKLKIELTTTTKDSNLKSFTLDITIAEVVGSKNSTKCFSINSNYGEILEVKATKKKTKTKFLTFHFDLKIVSNDNETIPEQLEEQYFIEERYKIYFQIVKKKNKLLYESEVFTDDGKFNIVQIPIELLENDFSIIFFDHKQKKLSKIDTDIKKMINSKKKLFYSQQLTKINKLNIYNYSSIKEEIVFLDYIKNGVRISLDIGIDFTASNGHPLDAISLHCYLPDQPINPYHKAILSCANIMANYDYDQKFPVYGFGAIINETNEPSMCFNINFKDDPNIQFVENILNYYYACLDKIIFSNPTNFAPIINKIIGEIKEKEDIFEYHVLMIITDGIIDDYEDTVEALVKGSFLPLSVIIIGVGDADFTKMERLDGDDEPLIAKNGRRRQRDIVQFVPFDKYKGDEKKLTEEVLAEIPRQIIEYYTLNFLYPENITQKIDKIDDEEKESESQHNNLKASTFLFEDPQEERDSDDSNNYNDCDNYNNNRDEHYYSNNNSNNNSYDRNNNSKSQYFINNDSNNDNQQLEPRYNPYRKNRRSKTYNNSNDMNNNIDRMRMYNNCLNNFEYNNNNYSNYNSSTNQNHEKLYSKTLKTPK